MLTFFMWSNLVRVNLVAQVTMSVRLQALDKYGMDDLFGLGILMAMEEWISCFIFQETEIGG